MTMQLISTVTLASAAASIDFTSIPQTGTDLLLVASLRLDYGSVDGLDRVLLNGTASDAVRRLEGSGSAVASTTAGPNNIILGTGTTATANTFANVSIYIPNYTSAIAKTGSADMVSENNATAASQRLEAIRWSTVTSAVTSLTIDGNAAILAGSTASLYTITKGSGGATVS